MREISSVKHTGQDGGQLEWSKTIHHNFHISSNTNLFLIVLNLVLNLKKMIFAYNKLIKVLLMMRNFIAESRHRHLDVNLLVFV